MLSYLFSGTLATHLFGAHRSMASLADTPDLVGFFSYSREDDEGSGGRLSKLRERIQEELRAQLGRTKMDFRLWQDKTSIAHGELWEDNIKKAVSGSVFFIPIITPTAVKSRYCKFEFETFLAREKELDRTNLVFPILYIPVPALMGDRWREDPLLAIIGSRQYEQWQNLRHLDPSSTEVALRVEKLCENICKALEQPWLSPQERQQAEARRVAEQERRRQEAEAQQAAEEERRRQEVEARRVAEEERRRQEAEAQQAAEEERRRQEVEARRAAEEERRRQEVEARRVAEEERRRQEAEAQQATEEERRRQEVEARRAAEEERRRQEAKAQQAAEEERRRREAGVFPIGDFHPQLPVRKRTPSKTVLAMIGGLVVLVLGSIGLYWSLYSAPPAPESSKGAVSASSPAIAVTDCDWLAADRDDVQRPTMVSGVPDGQINVASALVACNDAVSKYPNVARFSYQLGRVLEQSKDYPAARSQYERAASLGSTVAISEIGALYWYGYGVTQDYGEAKRWWEKAAAAGDRAGMSSLGVAYLTGNGVKQDYAEAKRWLEKAAAAGYPTAMTELGNLYDAGNGVTQDYAEAKRWYEKGAAAGNSRAMTNIGYMYYAGNGVTQDYAEAKRWHEKGAAAGNSRAMSSLGYFYELGEGVTKDYAEAKRWFEKAAAADEPSAMFGLGILYSNGYGVKQDYSEARRWFEKAAAKGLGSAMIQLGDLYRDGLGVTKSVADARTWYQKAAAAGNADAKGRLAALPSK
jgi:TPR repeat protein